MVDIKTYAVTPLNEECGLIEWVDNLRTLRDLVTRALKERGITPNVRLKAFYRLKLEICPQSTVCLSGN
jgi:phosphatidylinositol kinase/protein kinase (PI-3  family)